jgi:hypothetical protein
VAAKRADIVGNRVMLLGAVVYLLEWVAIIAAGDTGPVDPGTRSPRAVFDLYAAHPRAVGFLASWVSLVLLGRIVLVLGLRSALRTAGHDSLVIDVAVWAMAVSVVVEVVTYAVVGAGAAVASGGGSVEVVNGLDATAGLMNRMIFAPLGVAVGLGAVAMLRSGLFPLWMTLLGAIGAVLLVAGGVVSGPGYVQSGAFRALSNVGMVGVPFFWLWMLSTGVFLFVRAPRRTAAPV